LGKAALVRELFIQHGELTAPDVRRILTARGRRTSYQAIERLFYGLRQLGLIRFVREEPGDAVRKIDGPPPLRDGL